MAETTGDGSSGRPRADDPPASFPNIPPPQTQNQMADYSGFILHEIVELHKNVSSIGTKVDRLITDVQSQSEKIDRLRLWIARISGAAAVLGFALYLWREKIVSFLVGG